MQFWAGNKIPSVVFFGCIFYTYKTNATCSPFLPFCILHEENHQVQDWTQPRATTVAVVGARLSQAALHRGHLVARSSRSKGCSRGAGEPAAKVVWAPDWVPGKGARQGQARKPKQAVRKAGASAGHSGGKRVSGWAEMGLLGLEQESCSPVVILGFKQWFPTIKMHWFWFWRHKGFVKCHAAI